MSKIEAGCGYEFCQMSEAEEWYDFKEERWKPMAAAGYHCDNKLYRKKWQRHDGSETPPVDPEKKVKVIFNSGFVQEFPLQAKMFNWKNVTNYKATKCT